MKVVPSLATLILVATTSVAASDVSEDVVQMALEWAPLLWMHGEDPFYPSTVDFFLDNTEVRDANETLVQADPTATTIVIGEGTEEMHLNTFEDLECVSCTRPFFSGQTLAESPVYALVTEYKDPCETVDVAYGFFSPYNYGKDTCVGLETEDGECRGFIKTFGNHVGDWEHVEIRFQGGKPTDIYISVHSFGASYAYNESTNTFDFYDGEPLRSVDEKGNKIDIEIDYPQTVYLVEGNHPEVFSANGSHGTWASEGVHTYFDIVIKLRDVCERGEAWRTWENMEIIDRSDPEAGFEGTEYQWVDFAGRWGNIQKLGCELEFISGECGLVPGPAGPAKFGKFGTPEC